MKKKKKLIPSHIDNYKVLLRNFLREIYLKVAITFSLLLHQRVKSKDEKLSTEKNR